METVIVVIIIAAAAAWLVRLVGRSLKCKAEGCACAGSCHISKFCGKNFTKPPLENKNKR
ncbi:MAG: hypothetical protein JXA92_12035 [candidate division Zixibacteria bacterium]|nr:hypothetical protein [candidate division Zixibacteria bacterium]